MKKIFITILISAFFAKANAQLTTQLNVEARPTASISAWASSQQVVTFVINNLSQSPTSFKIKTTLKTSDGQTVAVSDLGKVPAQNIFATGNLVLNANTVVPIEFMQFSGSYNNILQRTGKLPAGTYQLCVQLVDALEFTPITQEQCKIFNLAMVQLPFLVSPSPDAKLDKNIAQTAITFRWTPVVPAPKQEYVYYNIQVFEVLENQKPMQAFRTNMPVLDRRVFATTQTIWQPQLSMIDEVVQADSTNNNDSLANTKTDIIRTFIWTVQTSVSDAIGKEQLLSEGSVNGDGRSQPEVFHIIQKRSK
jgi:hypothetical protein